MRNPLYDGITGSMPGARDTVATMHQSIKKLVSAVVTRQQEQRAQKQEKPLKVTDEVDGT